MNKEKVIEVLRNEGKPMKTGEIAEKLGVDTKLVSKLIKELRKEGKVESPKRCYYSIKEGKL
ncbi:MULTISPECIES: HTH domain-containing protein [unclassified Thermosipho (in: thermotogales)]|uniref:HTH domain-containing protein n=1 Tax=unclassified Thermosipho (in: thermotogales) TaxID=2676525 RepID=UPI0009876269|nr:MULTISPECIES: HTH domain-containing protein [unclassified Thermosipho (in: thermotogales)]MBT1247633.1 transcriptional regulator [Thermosipho sp. 1244]OOC46132.1 transcriptional regulator [Thermosipho sp. 1223]